MNPLIRATSVCTLVLSLFSSTQVVAEPSFTWASPTPQGNDLMAMDYLDSHHGWAVGARGAAVRTTDGGRTWQSVPVYPSTPMTLIDIVAIDAEVAVAIDIEGSVWRTTDGGQYWTPIYNDPMHRRFFDLDRSAPETLVAVGDRVVLRSTDDGVTWTRHAHEDVEGELTDQCWVAPDVGLISGTFEIFRTDDGGVTLVPALIEASGFPFVAIDVHEHNGVAIAWDTGGSLPYHTTDGGATWYLGSADVLGYVNDVAMTDGGLALAVTEFGEVWGSPDLGLSWELRYSDPDQSGAMLDIDVCSDGEVNVCGVYGRLAWSADHAVTFTHASDCVGGRRRCLMDDIDRLTDDLLVAGASRWLAARLLWSQDGGTTWTAFDAPVRQPVQVAARDEVQAVIGGEDAIAWTGDGGVTWRTHDLTEILDLPPATVTVKDVEAKGASWFAALSRAGTGVKGAIIASHDDGVTWIRSDTGLPTDLGLADVSFLDEWIGFATGTSGRIHRTIDGGASWHLWSDGLVGALDWAVEATWLDASTALIASAQYWPGAPGGVWRTTDSGETWTHVHIWPVHDMHARDASTIIAVHQPQEYSEADIVARSEDGGATWAMQELASRTRYAGYDVWVGAYSGVALERGFIVGGHNSMILKGEDEPTISVSHSQPRDLQPALVVSASVGAQFEISLRLPELSDVTLEIVDVTGRRVRSLVPAPGDSPWRHARWDGRDLGGRRVAPGVYFVHVPHVTAAAARMVVLR